MLTRNALSGNTLKQLLITQTLKNDSHFLLNIDMSFVGTRPEVPKFVDAYSPEMLATLLLPAGITSRASVFFKDEDEILKGSDDVYSTYLEKVLPKKMELNLESLRKFSCTDDIKTMFLTVKVVFIG